jgi:hypothetical protein
MSRTRIGAVVLALVVSLLGVAAADGPRVIIEPRVFLPEAEFPVNDGYYRTNDGYYYHYDRDRHGWHYGRNHEEGLRYEREHEWRREHRR